MAGIGLGESCPSLRCGFPRSLAKSEGVLRLHFLDVFWGRTSAKLAVVHLLERVDVGAHDLFVHHEWQALVPPAIECLAEFGNDFGVMGGDIVPLRVIFCDVEQLPCGLVGSFFADESPLGVPNGSGLEFVKVWVGELWPAADMREEGSVLPSCCGVFEQADEASSFDL